MTKPPPRASGSRRARRRSTLRTIVALGPPVIAAISLAIAGLALVRHFVSPMQLAASSDAAGNYLQTLGSIYAVLLAFVVFVVWTQFNQARENVEHEASELVDLYRTSQGLPQAERAILQDYLRRYVDVVLADEWPAMASCGSDDQFTGGRLLDQAWDALHPFEPGRECEKALFAEALARFNDLSDARTARLTSARLRIPTALRLLLYLGAFTVVASMALLSVDSFALHAIMTGAMAGGISHVLYVIEDLDDCFAGDWQVPTDAFHAARAYMTPAGAPLLSSGTA